MAIDMLLMMILLLMVMVKTWRMHTKSVRDFVQRLQIPGQRSPLPTRSREPSGHRVPCEEGREEDQEPWGQSVTEEMNINWNLVNSISGSAGSD